MDLDGVKGKKYINTNIVTDLLIKLGETPFLFLF